MITLFFCKKINNDIIQQITAKLINNKTFTFDTIKKNFARSKI